MNTTTQNKRQTVGKLISRVTNRKITPLLSDVPPPKQNSKSVRQSTSQVTHFPVIIQHSRPSLPNLPKGSHHIPKSKIAFKSQQNLKPPTTELEFNYRHLKAVPNLDRYKNSLEKLNLAYNLINHVPITFLTFPHITTLNLRSNNFTEFPEVVCSLPNLKTLDISQNKIRLFPEDPGSLLNLEILDISRNQLCLVPAYFGRARKIRVLKLDFNPILAKHDILAPEKMADRKKWMPRILEHLRALEEAGLPGLGFPSRSTLPVKSKHRPQSLLPEPIIAPKPSKSLTVTDIAAPSDPSPYHTPERAVIQALVRKSLPPPAKKPINSYMKATIIPDLNQPSLDRYKILQECRQFFNHNPDRPSSHQSFHQLLFVGYFILDRFDSWCSDFPDAKNTWQSTHDLLKCLQSSSSSSLVTLAQNHMKQVTNLIKTISLQLPNWLPSVSSMALKDLAYSLYEAIDHFQTACKSFQSQSSNTIAESKSTSVVLSPSPSPSSSFSSSSSLHETVKLTTQLTLNLTQELPKTPTSQSVEKITNSLIQHLHSPHLIPHLLTFIRTTIAFIQSYSSNPLPTKTRQELTDLKNNIQQLIALLKSSPS